jgi:hypothetical protein
MSVAEEISKRVPIFQISNAKKLKKPIPKKPKKSKNIPKTKEPKKTK